MNSRCLCGLDHSQPLPDSFEGIIPIVHGGGTGIPFKAFCHVCNSEWNLDKEEEKHSESCAYLLYKNKERAMFKSAKVGDKVWSIEHGEVTIQRIVGTASYQIGTSDDDGNVGSYTYEGKYNLLDKFPSLFWTKPYDKLPERQKRKVKKQIRVNVSVDSKGDITSHIVNLETSNCKWVSLTGEVEIEE